jgi:hypothetical protein
MWRLITGLSFIRDKDKRRASILLFFMVSFVLLLGHTTWVTAYDAPYNVCNDLQGDAQTRCLDILLHQEAQMLDQRRQREEDREDRREAAALQALGLALSGGGPMRSYAPVYQPPVMQPFTPYQPSPRTRMNCLSQQYGNQTMTNCQ